MSEYRPAKGDRVKVTIEGKVTRAGSEWAVINDHHDIYLKNAKVEKIEPPVEVFKPGDVVKNSAYTYVLTPDGFLVVAVHHPYGTGAIGRFVNYGSLGRYEAKDFNSRDFERVNVG